jgi:hypothetical protein
MQLPCGVAVWPVGLKCSCAGLGAGGAGVVQLLPVQRAAAGRRASCSPQRGSGGRPQLRSRRAGSRLWPGGLKCSCAGLGAGGAGGVQLLPALRAAAGRRASCSPQRGFGGRLQCAAAVRGHGFGQVRGRGFGPGELKCSCAGFGAGGVGGVQLLPAQRAAAGRRASCSPQRGSGGRLQLLAQPPCGVAAWARWAVVQLRGPQRRRSWRCPAAAG